MWVIKVNIRMHSNNFVLYICIKVLASSAYVGKVYHLLQDTEMYNSLRPAV